MGGSFSRRSHRRGEFRKGGSDKETVDGKIKSPQARKKPSIYAKIVTSLSDLFAS